MELKWNDIKSSTMDTTEYMEHIKQKEDMRENYKNYSPKRETLKKISNLLSEKEEVLYILAIGADWCHDCAKQVPSMMKVVQNIKENLINFQILYGVKTNPFHKEDEPLWHENRSPPEATNPKFDLEAIPTFYFFNNEGKYLDRIVEKPKENSTLEEDILEILQNNL